MEKGEELKEFRLVPLNAFLSEMDFFDVLTCPYWLYTCLYVILEHIYLPRCHLEYAICPYSFHFKALSMNSYRKIIALFLLIQAFFNEDLLQTKNEFNTQNVEKTRNQFSPLGFFVATTPN